MQPGERERRAIIITPVCMCRLFRICIGCFVSIASLGARVSLGSSCLGVAAAAAAAVAVLLLLLLLRMSRRCQQLICRAAAQPYSQAPAPAPAANPPRQRSHCKCSPPRCCRCAGSVCVGEGCPLRPRYRGFRTNHTMDSRFPLLWTPGF
jgi:hypothetical protein